MADASGVNWGRFRLQKYESMYSICAKFSALNGISEIEAVEYISKNIGVAPDSPFLTSDLQAKKLSALLDEPLSVALTLKRPNKYCQHWPLEMLGSPSGLDSPDDIIFCLECTKLDFHGLFQTFGCIPVCPIHNRPLTRFNSKTGKSGVDRIVRNLVEVYRQYNHQWPVATKLSRRVRGPSQPETILEYIYWSYHAQQRRHQFKDATLWSYYGQGLGKPAWCSSDVATALLVIQQTLSHGSEEMSSLMRNFKNILAYEQVLEYHFYDGSEQLLRQAFSAGVIYLYELWWTWTGRARVREQTLSELVSRISKDHINCDCKWLRHGSDKRWIESSRLMINRTGYLCPYRYVANFLQSKWGNLDASIPRSERDEKRWAYARLAEEMSNKGMVSCDHLGARIIVSADSNQPLELQWRLPKQIIETMEQCMSTALELDLSMCLEWLTLVDQGECPSVCKTEPQSAVALFDNNTVGIFTWRVSASNAEA
jgi:hypothetical protein